jgi:hypothetical protein
MSYVYSMSDECLFKCKERKKKKEREGEERARAKERKKRKNIDVKGRKHLADQVDYWYCCSIKDHLYGNLSRNIS